MRRQDRTEDEEEMATEEIDYAEGEATGLAAAFADGSVADLPLSTVLRSAGTALSNPAAVRSAFGLRGPVADADEVLHRCIDLWTEQSRVAARDRAFDMDSQERETRRAATMRSIFRFSTDTDARAVMESADNGDTSPLLRMQERYVFG